MATSIYELENIDDMGFVPESNAFRVYILHNSETPDFVTATCTLKYGTYNGATFEIVGQATAAFSYKDESSETGDNYLAVDFDFPNVNLQTGLNPAVIVSVTATKRNGVTFTITSNITRVMRFHTINNYWNGGYCCYNVLESIHTPTRTVTVTCMQPNTSTAVSGATVQFQATDGITVTGKTNANGIAILNGASTNAGIITATHPTYLFSSVNVGAGTSSFSHTMISTGTRPVQQTAIRVALITYFHEDEFTASGYSPYVHMSKDHAVFMSNVNVYDCKIRVHSTGTTENLWYNASLTDFYSTDREGCLVNGTGDYFIDTGLKASDLFTGTSYSDIDIMLTVGRAGFERKTVTFNNCPVMTVESDNITYIIPESEVGYNITIGQWSGRSGYEKTMLRRTPNKLMTAEAFWFIWQDAIARLNGIEYVVKDYVPVDWDASKEAWEMTVSDINGGSSAEDVPEHILNYYHRGDATDYPVIPKWTTSAITAVDLYFLTVFTEYLADMTSTHAERPFTNSCYRAYDLPESEINALGTGINNRSFRLDKVMVPLPCLGH